MFGLFKKKDKTPEVEHEFIVININARIQPMHRGEIYEDPLEDILIEEQIGVVAGGGTLQSKSGEIENCDIEIQVQNSDDATVALIKEAMEKLGTPKGSKLIVEATGTEIEIGTLEGLALYLNGTDLDKEVYANSDSNHVYSELP